MKRLPRLLAAGATVAAAVTAIVFATLPASASTSSTPRAIRIAPPGEASSFPAALAESLLTPNASPLGANDFGCHPSSAHPFPVVLVHGTFENMLDNWNGLSPILKAAGYCVFAFNYGNTTGIPGLNGTGDMIQSANAITPFVNRVLSATHASKVDLIGHSQGGALIRYYTDLLGGAAHVDQVIAITPSNHFTTLDGLTQLAHALNITQLVDGALDFLRLPAAVQQTTPNSPFYVNVNGHGETVPGMSYTVIGTRNDEVVTPFTQSFITAGPGATVDNITLQNVCGNDQSDHLSASYSKNVAQIILNKLAPNDQHAIHCYPQAAITGSTGA
jgi:triacylglycerol esterase/lipase EstA (alpha/beta hydrolase family)